MYKVFWIFGLVLGILHAGNTLKVPGSFSAHFVHSVVGKGNIYLFSGSVNINRSRAFRWTYRKPYRRLICNLNSGVDVIDYRARQVTRYRVGSLLDLMQILKVAQHVARNRYTSRYHGYRFMLWVNRRGEVSRVTFRDKAGYDNTIVFSSIRYRKRPLPASRFQCHAPRSFRLLRP